MYFSDCLHYSNQPIANFFEKSLYFDGLSHLFGYHHIDASSLKRIEPTLDYQKTILTVIKIALYILLPIVPLFCLVGKAICRISLHHLDSEWFRDSDLTNYFHILSKKYPNKVFLANRIETSISIKENICHNFVSSFYNTEEKPLGNISNYQQLAFPLTVGGNHWALLLIDRKKRTVEYYDSKKDYGDHQKICRHLKKVAKVFSRKDPGSCPYTFSAKINKKLQLDTYECGPWALFFLEKNLENRNVNFNQLDPERSRLMIARYRIFVKQQLKQLEFSRLRYNV